MTLYRLFILTSIAIWSVNGTLKPKDVEPGWLTLATGSSSNTQEAQTSSAGHQSPSQVPQRHQHNPQEAVYPIQQSITAPIKKPGQYVRTKETADKQRAYWTSERRMKQREESRKMRIGKLLSDESKKEGIGEIQKRKRFSQSTREKMRKSHLGLKASEATKEKMRESKRRKREQKREEQLTSPAADKETQR